MRRHVMMATKKKTTSTATTRRIEYIFRLLRFDFFFYYRNVFHREDPATTNSSERIIEFTFLSFLSFSHSHSLPIRNVFRLDSNSIKHLTIMCLRTQTRVQCTPIYFTGACFIIFGIFFPVVDVVVVSLFHSHNDTTTFTYANEECKIKLLLHFQILFFSLSTFPFAFASDSTCGC